MSTPHQSKANGKGYDWDDEFGCSEDTSLSYSLPLPLNDRQSVTHAGGGHDPVWRVCVCVPCEYVYVQICVCVCVCVC